MPQKHRAKNRLHRRAIGRQVQIVVQAVARVERQFAQIAVRVLRRNHLEVKLRVEVQAVDHAENRSKDRNEN